MKETDFNIIQKPVAIKLTCPHCNEDIKIPWDNLNVPEYWGDDWGEIDCPECDKTIKLGDYDID